MDRTRTPFPPADRFVVTGCASGIGRVVADRLVARGHRVLATDLDLDALEHHAVEQGWPSRARRARLDVTSADDWRRVLAEADDAWDGLDVLYNIAGYLQPGYAHAFALEDIDRHFDINVKGVMIGARLAAARMVAQGHGHIVNIASMAALAPVPGLSLYSASKYAVRSFSLAAAVELADHGVAVTVVCPDAVATPMLDKQVDYDEAALTFSGARVLTADEVAEAITTRVLRDRPMELALPWSRKVLARIADLVPEVAHIASPLLRRQGRAKQSKKRDE
ncbi:MAG: SDR family oxidoreductase [Polyangiaceae bacterium]